MAQNLLVEIADQAAVVRELQRRYFSARTQTALVASKAAEHTLDDLLGQYAAVTAKKNEVPQQIGMNLESPK